MRHDCQATIHIGHRVTVLKGSAFLELMREAWVGGLSIPRTNKRSFGWSHDCG